MFKKRSKRFVKYTLIIEKVASWFSSVPSSTSVPYYDMGQMLLLQDFPETCFNEYRRINAITRMSNHK